MSCLRRLRIVKKLIIGLGHADDGHGLTFGEQSYETSGDELASGAHVYSDIPVARGVNIRDRGDPINVPLLSTPFLLLTAFVLYFSIMIYWHVWILTM